MWQPSSPRGDSDESKWNAYQKSLEVFTQIGCFSAIYELSYAGQHILYKGVLASMEIQSEIQASLPNNYVYNWFPMIRECSFTLGGISFNSIYELYKYNSPELTEGDFISIMQEEWGLTRVPYEAYKALLPYCVEITINDI